jgi:hypothetical protein
MSITSYPQKVSFSSTGNTVSIGGTNLDAFGRLRVSQPYTLFDSQNRYAADPQFDTSTATGGAATHLSNESSVSMAVTTTSGSEVVRQTYRVFPYQPGKSLLLLATFKMDTAKANLRQRVGYFNTGNGVFLEKNGTGVPSFVVRTSTSGSASDARYVDQTSWNGDKLDGTGTSGITLDLTTTQILFLDFEWLGVGSVRCGFVINGQFIVCHTFHNANIQTAVYMTTAILPVRYEITNTGTTASSSAMKQICSSVMSEGGYDSVSADQIVRRTAVLATISTTFLPLLSMRLNSSRLGAVILPNRVAVLPTTNQNYEVVLVKNSTLTGASYVTSSFNNVDYDVTATAMTGGTIVQSDFVTSSSQGRAVLAAPTGYNFDLQLGSTIAGVSDTLTLGIRTVSGSTSGDAFGSLSFYDLT